MSLLSCRTTAVSLAAMLSVAGCRASAPAGSTGGGGAARTASSDLPGSVTPAMVAEGDSLFNRGACVRCHAANGVGGANAPSLTTGPWLHGDGSYARLVAIITGGIPRESLKDPSRRFAMNPRGGPMNLTDAQVGALAAYVFSISRRKQNG